MVTKHIWDNVNEDEIILGDSLEFEIEFLIAIVITFPLLLVDLLLLPLEVVCYFKKK